MSRLGTSLTITAAVASAAGLAACGVSPDGAMNELGSASTPASSAATRTSALDRPTGQLTVDGSAPGSLTASAIEAYRNGGGSVSVQLRDRDADAGFDALCRGETDLVDSARPMTREEEARCGAQGRTPLQFTIAADAVVLAMQGEHDLGIDCLNLDQVREVFRAGSPIYDWSQLGRTDAALRVGGPTPDAPAFKVFGQVALDAAAPSITDVRSDYRGGTTAQTLRFITGDAADAVTASRRPLAASRARAAEQRATEAAASQREATSELVAARRDQRKGAADRRPAAQQRRDRQRVVTAEASLRRATSFRRQADAELAQARRAATQSAAAARRQAALRGRVAAFAYRDYALVADRVRALEISQRSGSAASCSFPSIASVSTGDYALSRQLRITTTSDELERPEVQAFLGSYLRRARALARAAGLVPIPQSTVTQQQSWLRDPVATERAAQRDADPQTTP